MTTRKNATAAEPTPDGKLLKVALIEELAAGAPTQPPSRLPDSVIEIRRSWLPFYVTSDDIFALTVKGNDFTEVGIYDGDIVLMKYARHVNDGEMVAAWLEDQKETTIQYFYRQDRGILLEPAFSHRMSMLLDSAMVKVQGKVLAIVRRYDSPSFAHTLVVTNLERVEIQLGFRDESSRLFFERLTPSDLAARIGPYLKAIDDLQQAVDEIRERVPREVAIRAIRQYSPVSVTLEGATEAVRLVRDFVVPWRKEHNRQMARLAEIEKEAEIEVKRAEIMEKRARATREREEAQRVTVETELRRMETEKLKLENEKLRLEVESYRVQLALGMLEKVGLNLPKEKKVIFLVRLLEPLKALTESELDISMS